MATVVPMFSASAVCFGVTVFFGGSLIDRLGPRSGALFSAGAWGSGLMLCAAACQAHSLPLLFAGYGVMGGIGWGLGYISPISGIMAWFPDKRGLVSGMGMAAFGLGAMTVSPLAMKLQHYFSEVLLFCSLSPIALCY